MPLLNMDCLLGLQLLPANSVDSIVTDPPYELGFMGKAWDASGIAYNVALWREALRVLKPGGHLLSFGGSRTYHRMACAIEDGGFEVRDQIMWVYGSGFPKSLDVSKAIDKAAGAEREILSSGKALKRMIPGADQNATGSWVKDNGREYVPTVTAPATAAAAEWDGWGTALKPAHEPICVARKPLAGTVAANVLAWGTGALNIDGCRVPHGDTLRAGSAGMPRHGEASASRRYTEKGGTNFAATPGPRGGDAAGRWPANFIHDGSAEIIELFPAQAGARAPVRGTEPSAASSGRVTNLRERAEGAFHDDTGSAARFFYCAKASQAERGEGNTHPTVKPLALVQHLQRLVTPPRGLTLDLFTGSGTAMVAAKREGFQFLGFELSPEYCAIAEGRANA